MLYNRVLYNMNLHIEYVLRYILKNSISIIIHKFALSVSRFILKIIRKKLE